MKPLKCSFLCLFLRPLFDLCSTTLREKDVFIEGLSKKPRRNLEGKLKESRTIVDWKLKENRSVVEGFKKKGLRTWKNWLKAVCLLKVEAKVLIVQRSISPVYGFITVDLQSLFPQLAMIQVVWLWMTFEAPSFSELPNRKRGEWHLNFSDHRSVACIKIIALVSIFLKIETEIHFGEYFFNAEFTR